MVDWDSALFVLATTGMTMLPALVAVPWLWITKSSTVRRILKLILIAALATPILTAGLLAMFTGLCEQGHINQAFENCGWVSPSVAQYGSYAIWFTFIGLAPFLGLFCAWIEIKTWRAKQRSSKT